MTCCGQDAGLGPGLRGGNDDFGVDQFLVELAVLALLIGGGDEGVALGFNPRSQAQLVLGRAQQLGLLFGMLMAL